MLTASSLALGALAGPALFTAAWLILGVVSPGYVLFGTHVAPYSAISQPVSGLGLGVTAPLMNAAFVVSGMLVVAGAAGVAALVPGLSPGRRRSAAALLALPGIGSIADGLFTLESMGPHLLGFLLVLTPIAAFPILGVMVRRVPGWRRLGWWLIAGGPLTLVLAMAFFGSFDPEASGRGLGIAGLTQRALILEIHAYYVALAWHAVRAARE
jgi:hypothetical protein